MRSKYGMLDDGARFHVITHLILEIVNFGKFMLATSILGRDDPVEVCGSSKEAGFILGLIQRDRVLAAAVDEAKSVKSVNVDRLKQLQDLRVKLDEHSLAFVHLSIPSVLITPKRKLAGHLAIVQNVLHFAGEFIVEAARPRIGRYVSVCQLIDTWTARYRVVPRKSAVGGRFQPLAVDRRQSIEGERIRRRRRGRKIPLPLFPLAVRCSWAKNRLVIRPLLAMLRRRAIPSPHAGKKNEV
ncbi:hypothetical protein B296_00048261, partial [Ensete ventricosum]